MLFRSTEIPFALASTINGAVSGIPGDFTIKSAERILASECAPCSNSTPKFVNWDANFSLIAPRSETKTVQPCLIARIAAPTPLSPAPKMAIFPGVLFKLSNFQRYDGDYREQNGHDPKSRNNFCFVQAFFLVMMMQWRH